MSKPSEKTSSIEILRIGKWALMDDKCQCQACLNADKNELSPRGPKGPYFVKHSCSFEGSASRWSYANMQQGCYSCNSPVPDGIIALYVFLSDDTGDMGI